VVNGQRPSWGVEFVNSTLLGESGRDRQPVPLTAYSAVTHYGESGLVKSVDMRATSERSHQKFVIHSYPKPWIVVADFGEKASGDQAALVGHSHLQIEPPADRARPH